MRLAIALAGLVALSGCQLSLPSPGDTPTREVREIGLRGGRVTVAAPEGYCVDTASSNRSQGFALIVPCDRLMKRAGRSDDAILTAQVGRPGSATVSGAEIDLARLLTEPSGRSILARSGDASRVRNVDASSAPGVVTVWFTDMSDPLGHGATHRAFFDIDGRLVTLSVRGLIADGLSQSRSDALLDKLMAATLSANQG